MKKSLAYVVVAVMLGVSVMLFPLLLFFPSEISTTYGGTKEGPLPPSETAAPDLERAKPEAEGKTPTAGTPPVEGMTTFPSSLLYASFITVLGFGVALGVSQYYKRRIA